MLSLPFPFFNQISAYVNDIAFVIYTGALVVWGIVFAFVLRKKWGVWRHSHKFSLFTSDEWIIIGLMLVGLLLGMVYMLTFLHGKPPGVPSLRESSAF